MWREKACLCKKENKKDQKRMRGGAKYTVATTERGIKIDEM